MLLRYQFCSATAAGILKGRTLPYCGCPCIICCSLGSIYGPAGFCYYSPRLQSWLPSHVSSLRMEKAPVLAAFFNTLRLPLLSKAFTSLGDTLKTYFPLPYFIHPSYTAVEAGLKDSAVFFSYGFLKICVPTQRNPARSDRAIPGFEERSQP